jgi:hypothetical protein
MTRTQECVDEGADRLQPQQLHFRTPIEPRPQGCAIPLTAEQRHFFNVLIRADPKQRPIDERMCASATRITGPLSLSLLEGSIAGLVRRHESLRTTFRTFEGVATQHIDPPDEYRLTCVDLSMLSVGEAESRAKRLIGEFQAQKIDVSIGQLFEARLFKLATREHVLIVLADHMISDGMSNALLDREIWQAYDEGLGDEPALLPTPPLQFADYAVWCERTNESWRKEHEGYWKRRLAEGVRVPTLIPVSSETNKCPEVGTVAHIPFGSALTAQLRQFAQRQQVSLSNVALMIYATAMSLWCDKEDLIIRCPVHGRHHRPELESVVGFFASYLCLRITVNRRHTLQSLLAQVQDEMRCALAHRDFDRMRNLMPECVETELEFHWRSARRRGRAQRRPNLNQPIKRQPFLIRSPTWHLNFWCIFNETPADVCVTVRYRPHLLRPNVVEQFGDNLRSIAETLIDRPLDPIDRAVFSRGRGMYDAP